MVSAILIDRKKSDELLLIFAIARQAQAKNTHAQIKIPSQKVERATKSTEWKSIFSYKQKYMLIANLVIL